VHLFLDNCSEISDQALIGLLKNTKQLEALSVPHCKKITDSTLFQLVKTCPKIISLVLHATQVTNAGIKEIASSYPNLIQLGIDCLPVNDQCLIQLFRNCTKLEYLYMSKCTEVTQASIRELSFHCRKLKDLDLSGIPLADSAIRSIAVNCKNLLDLNISKTQITRESVELLILHRNLCSLNISNCRHVMNISDIINSATHLTIIYDEGSMEIMNNDL
jgi:hypothetical protein